MGLAAALDRVFFLRADDVPMGGAAGSLLPEPAVDVLDGVGFLYARLGEVTRTIHLPNAPLGDC